MTFKKTLKFLIEDRWDRYFGYPYDRDPEEWEEIQMFIDRWLELSGAVGKRKKRRMRGWGDDSYYDGVAVGVAYQQRWG